MSWFRHDDGDGGLGGALRRLAADRMTGVVLVAGRGGGGHVWLHDGALVHADADASVPPDRALLELGVLDAAALAALRATHAAPPGARPEVGPDVVAVLEELADVALGHLLGLPEGNVRQRPDDLPPLGVCSTRPVASVLDRVAATELRERAAALAARGRWAAVADGRHVQLSPAEWEVVVAMARPSSPADVAVRTGTPQDEVVRVMAGLAGRGVLQRLSAPAGRADPVGTVSSPPAPATSGGAPPAPLAVATPPRPTPVSANQRSASPSGVPGVAPGSPGAATVGGADPVAPEGARRTSALRRLISAVRTG